MPGAEPVSVANNQTPPGKSGRSELTARVISALLLAPLAVVSAYIGDWPFGVFWVIAAIGVWLEWNSLVTGADNRLIFILGTATLVLALVIAEQGMARIPMFIIMLGALGVGVFARADRRGWIAAGLLYAGAVLLGPILLRRDPDWGFVAVIFLFTIVWTTDVLGYFVGRTLGGPKLAPSISPKKTWSGAIGGAVAAIIVGVIVARLAGLDNLAAVAVVALFLSVIAQIGDLGESAVKRRFGAKDAGHLIPGHGGLMDRLDGFLAAAFIGAIFGMLRVGTDAAAQGLLRW
ncbi:MAG: phosphatidate cytidylyltransferase [Alphaproteobacteria bacterium]|nr:phosphatidate cytidylyltransferase [Alphaproteobacteria bacterium]